MPVKINIYNQKAEKIGEEEFSEAVFGLKTSEPLIHQALVCDLANARKVLAHTKDRSEVRGGGRKPWRQKGTGRARAGSSRSPLWRGGGIIFGPLKIRNFKKKINKKMKQKALCMVLSDKVKEGRLAALESLQVPEYKTKAMAEIIKGLEEKALKKAGVEQKREKAEVPAGSRRSLLVINDAKDEKVFYSVRNLAGVKMINLDNLNIVDLLKYKNTVMTLKAVKKIEERYK